MEIPGVIFTIHTFVVKEASINYIFTPAVEIKVEQQLSCSIYFCAFFMSRVFLRRKQQTAH
jgi:hypothetical protein